MGPLQISATECKWKVRRESQMSHPLEAMDLKDGVEPSKSGKLSGMVDFAFSAPFPDDELTLADGVALMISAKSK